jgi:FkbM family methyltransferase
MYFLKNWANISGLNAVIGGKLKLSYKKKHSLASKPVLSQTKHTLMTEIYQRIKRKKIDLHHVCEVGVYLPETSNILDFINEKVKTTLVEADPVTVQKIKTYFKNDFPIQLFPYAVWDYNGTLQFSKAKASTFVTQLQATPALINDGFRITENETFEVPCCLFSEFDDGTIDLISIDVEGSEWYALKYMKSRPKVISVETHGKFYTNPFLKEILAWTQINQYSIWYKDDSDTVFVRNDVFTVSDWEKFLVSIKNFMLSIVKLKRFIKFK